MKRIELRTGTIKRGFWNGEKFDYKLKSEIGTINYNFSEEEYISQFNRAKEFIKQNSGSPNDVEIWDIPTDREIFLFEKENVDNIINNIEAENFLIYLETNTAKLFICTSGIKNLAVPIEDYPEAGDYQIFTKIDLKNGYLSAIQQFETNSQSRGAVKLHIFPLKLKTD